MAQIKNMEVEPLPSLVENCNCQFNETIKYEYDTSLHLLTIQAENDIPAIFRLSYMWYSFIAAFLTIAIGTIVSIGFDLFVTESNTDIPKKNEKTSSYTVTTIKEPTKDKDGTINLAFEV